MTIFCIGRNYSEHAKELNNPIPTKPVVFCKPSGALLRENKPFFYPDFSTDIQYEIELVLKICRSGKSIPLAKCSDYYSHITVGLDLTARDLQQECKEKGLPWEISKGFDHSAIIGNWLYKNDLNLSNMEFELHKNKLQVQYGKSNEMLFSFEQIIHYLSRFFRLSQGDLIFTGTPSGVGPIHKGEIFEGFIEKKQLFSCEIK